LSPAGNDLRDFEIILICVIPLLKPVPIKRKTSYILE